MRYIKIEKSCSARLYYLMSWKSHETSGIVRQIRNMQEGGISSDEIIKYVLKRFDKLEKELDDIRLHWDTIEQFVDKNDEQGYVEYQQNKVSYYKSPEMEADLRQQFRLWVQQNIK